MNILGDWAIGDHLKLASRFKGPPFLQSGHWLRVRLVDAGSLAGSVEVYNGPILATSRPIFSFEVVFTSATKTAMYGAGRSETFPTWISAQYRDDNGRQTVEGFALLERRSGGAEDSGGQWGGRR